VAGSCEYGDEPSGSGTTELVQRCVLPPSSGRLLTSETSAYLYKTARQYIPEGCHTKISASF
jgi:hypothetical protein